MSRAGESACQSGGAARKKRYVSHDTARNPLQGRTAKGLPPDRAMHHPARRAAAAAEENTATQSSSDEQTKKKFPV